MEYNELLNIKKRMEEGAGDYAEPKEINLPKRMIYSFAGRISKAYREKIETSTNINLYDFVESLKGNVHCVNLCDYLKSGSIYVHAKEDFDIVLPMFTSPIRDRFTIAHEIGHYFLHSFAGEKKICANRRDSNRVEWEANWFAASFLMPKYLIDEMSSPNESKLADAFGVSEEAASYRLKNIGI
ncbi:MAG: ImmA/IrrE family metallo-endopeptidase [Fibrobacter sp.]|nr:ImmA/IrrE family metallo-endopeptidase [Fibrobacter sp.]